MFFNKKEDDYKFGNKYKFKSLKVYSSAEWMADSTKKYRQVFDRMETTYISAEFSFYNKLFDECEWEAKITLKAFNVEKKGKKIEICNQEETIKVKTDENVVSIRKGWGLDEAGEFWKKGEYIWEAYIDNKLVGSQSFYVEDEGKVTSENNPYFDFVSLKLFEGDFDGWKQKDRKYLKQFNRETTRYVWVEFSINNKAKTDWHLEYFISFFDDAGQLKAKVSVLEKIEKGNKNKLFVFERGWGSNEPGVWVDDKYTVEIVFMDTLVCVIPFEVGAAEIEGTHEVGTSIDYKLNFNKAVSAEDKPSLEEVLASLNTLIGLENIKKQIHDHLNYLDFLKLRKEKGFEENERITLHSVFTGNPGTGKTTVVNLLGKIYSCMGLLSKGHVNEVSRVDLVGEFIGQTAPKTKKAIDEARGGILFIDEAYTLAREDDDAKDFGKESIEVLLKEMSDGEGDVAIMLAGYPHEMNVMLNSNPGLRSRLNYYFLFEDYTPDELMQIAHYACKERNVSLTAESADQVYQMVLEAYRNRDKSFGNARYVYSIIDEGKMNLGLRLMKRPDVKELSNEELSIIQLEDILKINKSLTKKAVDIPIDEDLLKEAIAELNKLIGMSNIKKEINEQIKLVRYYRETNRNVLNQFSIHTVYTGNPGTGKTTVARIAGKIYKALGLLERGHVVECDRETLVAGYVGQTAIKTKAILEKAMGGILFIDEAYSLAQSESGHSYGNEAIEIILKQMEDFRGKFAVIVAGYPDNMNRFLKSNPGLHSRFDKTLVFNDYTPETLIEIAQQMLKNENLTTNAEAEEHLQSYFKALFNNRDKYFGNARAARKIVEDAVKNQHLRMASIAAENRTVEMMQTLTIEDVNIFDIENMRRRGGIGF